MSEVIVPKSGVPGAMPSGILVRFASREFTSGGEQIKDLTESGVQDIIKNVRTGAYESLFLSLDPDGDLTKYLLLESKNGGGRIFLQIEACRADEPPFFCASFDPDHMASDEESSIEASDGQSVILKKYTMKDRELAAKCVEWFIHTGEPYPGMDWLKG